MPSVYNPFKRKEEVNFPGVVVPLASAHARSPSPSSSQDPEKRPNPDEKSDDRSLDRSENGIGPAPQSGHLTVEGLKTEIEADLASSGHDSAYDRMFRSDCRPTASPPPPCHSDNVEF